MSQIIPVASGKGGVGKSLLSANLAIALGQQGKKVVLVDLDLGASNLHLVIGQKPGAASLGSWFTEKSDFKDIIQQTDYQNVSFIAGDSQIPDLTSLKHVQKVRLIRNLKNIDTDYIILDLGAGTHQFILDMFLLSPQGIVVSAPAVTATLNGYLFLKNATFRLLYTTFKRGTPGRAYLDNLKKDSATMQKLYIPNLIQFLANCDPTNTQIFISRMQQFRPRLVMNMIEDPKDADRAQRIKSSCNQYLGLEIEYLGLMYRDMLQDKALASQLPVVVYKPQSVLGQAIYRIADKIISTVPHQFDAEFNPDSFSNDNFQLAEEDATEDYNLKLSGIDDLVSSGSLSIGELAEMIKTQQYEINQLRKENNLLKSKLVKASEQGFRI
ncbi:MAG: AAA family ATPase [Spirochaetia bacterium]|nr:AAA family ATPase [Spirochaetia bacterium]MDD7610941.1 AAA family ATPase [Spirochaetales bacterium]MDY5916048.1 AAA family ATPase [Treponema sp.]